MRILDLIRRAKPNRTLVLDATATRQWPQQLVEHQGLDAEFRRFAEDIEETKASVIKTARQLTDEDVLAAIPDRARTMNALHGKEYSSRITKLMQHASFTDIFSFDKQQDVYFEAVNEFKDQTSKHTSVLKEFMHDELKAIQALLQQLEDKVINFTKTLEERQFPVIRRINDAVIKLDQLEARQEKCHRLLTSLEQDLKRTQEKRQKIEDGIKEQLAFVRNEQSLASLDRLQALEQELHDMAEQYRQLSQEVHTVYRKNPTLELTSEVKLVVGELGKDTLQFISGNAEQIKRAFEAVVVQFEEERPANIRTLVERLTRLAGSVEQDCRKAQTSAPDQRSLKKEMMKDIAALQVYDKRQFLMRAQAEEDAIKRKVEYLQAEVDPNKQTVLEREIKDAAKSMGALIKDEPVPIQETA